ncbi:MAG TPA: HU family DNA-binding protein [Thermodesulfobacteriota bacterium]|nr:HU family DNA-binding protein [Thermodesulfobacteriota bacterium]HNU71428.1 HU family DNA-binding protein [Thermodesulfobacteriota bacterium]HQO77387.1 HU family DNA-binding protein [Thermodesulfobacteriota bacterium]
MHVKRRNNMNKADLIDAVAEVTRSRKEAAAALDCVLDSITKALKKKEDVTLVGFGTFTVKKRKARAGRNPQTGEKIKIKAKSIPAFRPGKALKDSVK